MDKIDKVRALLATTADVDVAAYTGISVRAIAQLRSNQHQLAGADTQIVTALSGMYDDQHRGTQITERVMTIIKDSPDIPVYKAVDRATEEWEIEHAELVPARIPADAAGQDTKDTKVLLIGTDRLAYHHGKSGEILGRTRCKIGSARPNTTCVWIYRGDRQPLEFTRFGDDAGVKLASGN
ncbi:hypothetical protein [Lacticaseibacillus zhaodongensis]|uniref:hypothetical protein n=1 Tax=Lacticaseibacillus zhaodongensis TaxID=2668065 RepID=UPI0012D32732|nr:hypothetical protein [Lacticaseibacillus zhaodongensis]